MAEKSPLIDEYEEELLRLEISQAEALASKYQMGGSVAWSSLEGQPLDPNYVDAKGSFTFFLSVSNEKFNSF
jgi:hypothetical protein